MSKSASSKSPKKSAAVVAPEVAPEWSSLAKVSAPCKLFAGQRIVSIRPMTKKEIDDEGWQSSRFARPLVVVLSNGAKLYASSDDEGNGAGALFGRTPDDAPIYVREE